MKSVLFGLLYLYIISRNVDAQTYQGCYGCCILTYEGLDDMMEKCVATCNRFQVNRWSLDYCDGDPVCETAIRFSRTKSTLVFTRNLPMFWFPRKNIPSRDPELETHGWTSLGFLTYENHKLY
eukprot:snap_masked-scaffold_11-processed-gene-6.27-mRNA-1 protein AED:1.00 eAED:1.00 QI:0/0/0/0/1/1/2/0/122